MKYRSNIGFLFSSKKEAENFFKVLNPEVKSDLRVKTSMSLKDLKVDVSIMASDRNSFRSAVNSYARWTRLYEEIGGMN
jgi:tRNA threonylcarbamoyladenosine modification (KEOPS) complex  Pcc1 subunit